MGYKNIEQAQKALIKLTEEFALCEQINKLEKPHAKKACFGYGIKKCKGACIQQEEPATYNKRVEKLQEKLGITHKSIVFTCDGIKKHQTGFVLILNGYIKAFGYATNNTNFSNPAQLLGIFSKP